MKSSEEFTGSWGHAFAEKYSQGCPKNNSCNLGELTTTICGLRWTAAGWQNGLDHGFRAAQITSHEEWGSLELEDSCVPLGSNSRKAVAGASARLSVSMTSVSAPVSWPADGCCSSELWRQLLVAMFDHAAQEDFSPVWVPLRNIAGPQASGFCCLEGLLGSYVCLDLLHLLPPSMGTSKRAQPKDLELALQMHLKAGDSCSFNRKSASPATEICSGGQTRRPLTHA